MGKAVMCILMECVYISVREKRLDTFKKKKKSLGILHITQKSGPTKYDSSGLSISNLRSIQVAFTLQHVGDGVVGHVDGGVGEGLDHPLGIPWQLSAETKQTRACPFL